MKAVILTREECKGLNIPTTKDWLQDTPLPEFQVVWYGHSRLDIWRTSSQDSDMMVLVRRPKKI